MIDFSPSELMAVAAAREVRDGEVVLVGLGIPQIAADLAKLRHAPNIICLSEIGVLDPRPGGPQGVGNADPRLWRGAIGLGSFIDVMGHVLHRGRVDLGFLGALEVDARGNVNSTEVLAPDGSPRRFGGSGGANDIASHAGRVVIVCRHSREKLVARVRYVTSPGRSSEKDGVLPGGGPVRIVTDKAVLAVTEDGLRVVSVYPGVNPESLRECTGCEVTIERDVPETEPPDKEELAIIRNVLDPKSYYTRRPDIVGRTA